MTTSLDGIARVDAVRSHMKLWLKSKATGCGFAARLAGRTTEFAVLFSSDDSLELARLATEWVKIAAERERLAILAFPDLSEERDVAELVLALARTAHWRVYRVDVEGLKASRMGVDLRWQIGEGRESNAMGMAPWSLCPVSRRSPVVALALWPLPHANEHRKKPMTVVGIGDAPPGVDAVEYARLQKTTREKVASLRSVDPSAPTDGRVSFYFSAAEAERVFASAGA